MKIKSSFALLIFLGIFMIVVFVKVDKESTSASVSQRDWQLINFQKTRVSTDSMVMSVDSEACRNISVIKGECETYKTHEFDVTQEFPLHFISGAPGSGNDWIRWLATLHRYTPYTYIPDERKYPYAVYGYGHMLQPDASLVNTSKFMFFKSHEPWWHENGKEISSHAKRAALLLRHPYDACYSEYKRKLLMRRIDKDDKGRKNAAVSVSLEKFIESETGQLNPVWKDYIKSYTKKWMLHAKYWLVEFGKPLHILVYNDVRKNTAYEIESLQKFFGYRFDGPNIRRHCCVMADSMNPQLKRSKSDVDSYKEDIYEKDLEIVEQINSYIARVHKLLGSKYPKKFYRVNRG